MSLKISGLFHRQVTSKLAGILKMQMVQASLYTREKHAMKQTMQTTTTH